MLERPSAILPVAMSLAALALVIGHAAIYGIVHESDEGAAAHIFQILMVAQAPLVIYFAAKYLRRMPSQAIRVLALQAGAAAAAIASVHYLT